MSRKIWDDHSYALVVLFFVFASRIVTTYHLGAHYNIKSDDYAYVVGGIELLEHGFFTSHGSPFPSAQSMPGINLLIAGIAFFFGTGGMLWVAIKVIWAMMATATGWFIYKSVRIFAPKWAGVLALIPLFRVDYIWMDNLVLTETPFILSLSMMLYFTFQLGETQQKRYFWFLFISYIIGINFRPNVVIYPLFALFYLLLKKYNLKLLFKQSILVIVLTLLISTPWAVRNYQNFDAFIPQTFGLGNPMLLGTYQGYGYPKDESLDYTTNVDDVVKEEYSKYYDTHGKVYPPYQRYISFMHDKTKAEYRISEWIKTDWKGFLVSYVILKPLETVHSIFYWDIIYGVSATTVTLLQDLETLFIALTIILSIILKQHRKVIFYLTALYIVNIYILSSIFVFGRYNVALMPIRYILIGLGLTLVWQILAPPIGKLISKKNTAAEETASETQK